MTVGRVTDFSFPSEKGFTGSAGRTMVKGYSRGGKVSEPKVKTVMGEFKKGDLHSGSKSGPKVTDRKQAVAIALNQGRTDSDNDGMAKGGRVPAPTKAALMRKYANAKMASPKREPMIQPPPAPMPGGGPLAAMAPSSPLAMKRGGKVGC